MELVRPILIFLSGIGADRLGEALQHLIGHEWGALAWLVTMLLWFFLVATIIVRLDRRVTAPRPPSASLPPSPRLDD